MGISRRYLAAPDRTRALAQLLLTETQRFCSAARQTPARRGAVVACVIVCGATHPTVSVPSAAGAAARAA